MNQRRTLRFYDKETFPKRVLEDCIRAAGTAPSGKGCRPKAIGAHTEPWSYVVVEDANTKKALREAVEEEEKVNYGTFFIIICCIFSE